MANEKDSRMKRKPYEKELRKLQVELCHLQRWVTTKGLRVIILFEGRDAAGKGGTIKAITEKVSPRVFRTVALPAPSDREKTQIFFQRYMPHLPAAGEIVIFDRSWYNRAGVEYVMGFCTPARARAFPRSLSGSRKIHRRRRYHPDQVLARSRHGGAGEAVRRPDRRSAPAVETQSDGSSNPIGAGTTIPGRAI